MRSKKSFSFFSELDTTTTSADIMGKMKTFLKHMDCNGKMFVEFVPMKLLLCCDPGQALQKK